MHILVTGSRSIRTLAIVPILEAIPNVTLIIHGGAQGVDRIADNYAFKKGIKTEVMKPNYNKFGSKAAPIIRNHEMADFAIRHPPSMCVSFWDGQSRGTIDCVGYATQIGLFCKKYKVEGENVYEADYG